MNPLDRDGNPMKPAMYRGQHVLAEHRNIGFGGCQIQYEDGSTSIVNVAFVEFINDEDVSIIEQLQRQIKRLEERVSKLEGDTI